MSDAAALLEMMEVQTVARSLNLDLVTINVNQADEIIPAIEKLRPRRRALCLRHSIHNHQQV